VDSKKPILHWKKPERNERDGRGILKKKRDFFEPASVIRKKEGKRGKG